MLIEEKNVTTQARCLLRLPEVIRRTGYKRAHIYTLMKQNKFPKNVRLGARAVAWDSQAIEHWIKERI